MTGLIVHEWLEAHGGAEKVVDAMLEALPQAEVIALWNDAPDKYHHVTESWLARTPFRRHKAASLPLLPPTWRHIASGRRDVDFVLVSSHLFAHHIQVGTNSDHDIPKFVYAHSPARYIWEPSLDRRGASGVARAASLALKPLDRKRAQEADKIAANSQFVRERIRRTWERDSTVIYPPVDIKSIQSVKNWQEKLSTSEQLILSSLPGDFILGASRFVPYKRLDRVIRGAADLGLPAVIAGAGPDEGNLRRLADELACPITFVLDPSTALLYALYQAAMCYVFPAVEDFGIMPVEAQAAGAVVVTTSIGGATETINDGVTGVRAERDTQSCLEDAISKSLCLSKQGHPEWVSKFSKERFEDHLLRWMKKP